MNGTKSMTLRNYIEAPRRLFRRAKAVYVEKMVVLDENIGPIRNVSGFPLQAPPPPTFGSNYWIINHSNCANQHAVLSRTTSEKITRTSSEEFDDSALDEVRYSYSSLGLVSIIYEDKSYEFHEEINVRIDSYISQSRSKAIGRRNIGGYY
ncbi:hypothetical protein L2E82_35775 [Cichorium intybus]|uniref:Uncharacterized protein n=1 Tax=Cichorium intybus TaxID=13427 RepID=A0ACB9BPQ5_CICIN|nr:hypothetical protein L2E82_35775 [Cichorium intybus]